MGQQLLLRGVLAMAVGLAWLSSASAQQSVALLSLVSEDGDDGLAAELSDAVYTEASGVDEWNVSPNRPSLMQMTMANDCEITEDACRAVIGSSLGAQQVIYGTLRRSSTDAVGVELLMFDSAGGDVVASAHAQMPISNRDGLPEVAQRLLRALRGLPPLVAAPVPAAAPEDGSGRAQQGTQSLEPAAADDESPYTASTATSSNDWAGYALLGVAGVSLGGAIFSWLQIDGANGDENFVSYQRQIGRMDPAVPDVCDEAARGELYGLNPAVVAEVRDQCDRGATFETLQYVFIGAFVVSGGFGLYFLLDDESDDAASASLGLTPYVAASGSGLTARLTF